MKKFKKARKALALLLSFSLVLGMIPASALTAFGASEDAALTAALAEAKTYTDAITINNSSNDPATVVKNYGTHFTWDNEKRENSKDYLFDWSYYNGVVFEGIEYLYETTGEEAYKDYVVEYMSSLIKADGTWATCSNNSAKQCAGYNSTHGADCYKTASLLLDLYEMEKDSRYLTMAKTLYADLDTAATKYSLSKAGDNYRHTWSSDPSPDLWLDGLYMILPFRAEYAKYTNDTEELDLIVDRMQWVSDNMYNESKGLFYHAADSASSNSGTYWLRSVGWYAAAIVDIMDSMEGENLEAMKAQLVKLVDGMKACQNATNGMWLNNMAATQSTTNPYETSGTALVSYAVMKAVNEGWLDESYADMATLAFKGICNEKLSGTTLKDICFKGAPGDSNSTFYSNEGKGVGPFIMLYAEVQEYVKDTVTVGDTTIKVDGVTGLSAGTVTAEDKALLEAKPYDNFVAFDVTATITGEVATVTIPVPAEWNAEANELVGISVENGEVVEYDGTYANGAFTFAVDHFSAKGVAYNATPAAEDTATSVSGTGNLVGGKVYTLDTDGVTANKNYLIVNTASDTSGYALTNNNGSADSTPVTISGTGTNRTISVEDDTNIAWVFNSATSGTIKNEDTYIRLGSSNVLGDSRTLTTSSQGEGAYRISYTSGYSWGGQTIYYLRYNNDDWSRSTTASNVYLYEYTSSSDGEAVTFTVTPGSATIAPKNTTTLTGAVTVAGETVKLSDCTVTWASADTSKATVADGIVTGVADGTANITATLSAVNGTALQKEITLTIPVTVQSKTIVEDSEVLTGNDPVTTRQNVEPDFSNIKLTVTYDDGSKGVITVDNGLVIEGYDITKIGYSYATISYAGKEYGTVRVTVEGNPYEGKEEATVYPEYPADGAVRIDKTATEVDFENTGVVQVELDVAGVSVKPAVDVILVTDLSNSMAWAAGGRTDATSHENTKVYDLQQSVASFADIFLAEDEDGNATKNTMSLVTFGGYDADHTEKVYTDYADPTQTLLLGSKDAATVKNTVNNIRVLADDALNLGTSTTGYYLSLDGGKTYGENYGNTNYDHAFMQTADAIESLKAAYKADNGTEYDASGRQIYVLFMTDGAPSNYDGVYYNYKTGDRADVNCTWINSSGEEVTYTMGTNNAQYQAGPWFQYIAGGTYNTTTGTIPGNPLYWADQVYNTANVANIYSIGFDLDNGGFSSMTFTEADGRPLSKVLEKLVTGQTLEVFSADDKAGLSAIYADLATKIRYAGTNANVTDVVDSDFTLQLTQTTGTETAKKNGDLGFKPTITVTGYDLWTKEETTDVDKIGTRQTANEGGTITNLETVTFSNDGSQAYSDKVENGAQNIMNIADDGTVTIEAHFFTYVKTPEGVETFKWRLGNITDQEVVLSFYAYLKGSLEGERAKGLYYTNEEAILEYIDVNDKHATQEFPVPAVAWGGASTAYEFYLVNEAGQPCDRDGNVIPFANRIIITGPYYEELYLNQEDEEKAKEIIAAYVLPAGYTLYDETAKYTVVTASGTIEGSLTISSPAAGKVQTTIEVSATKPSYIQSRVAFGVIYNQIPTEATFELAPNKVVIDYGKSILINTKDTDETLEDGYTATLVGFSKYYDTVDLKHKFTNTSAVDNYSASYGTFSIEDASKRTVRYSPTTFVNSVEKVFCVVKMHNNTSNDTYYMVDALTVIPATNVYYETDFAAGVFSTVTTGETWKTKAEGPEADGPQNDGTIGIGQIYGYDSTYDNDSLLSNGSSLFVEGQGIKLNESTANYTYSQFEFKGTGFDLISRTGAAQGAIRVDIYTDAARTAANRVKSVTVLNKSESDLELYQIPVVSVNDLAYGTYYVTVGVNAAYENANYPQLSRGGEFYFDAVRVYDPAQGNTEAEAAYVSDGESKPIITEVRAQLIAAGDYDVIDASESVDGMSFIDRTQDGVDVATYETIGPNNEVYLSNGQGVAFEVSSDADIASIDVAAKAPNSGAAARLTANISDTSDTIGTEIEKDITSATPQYYDLMENATTDLATIFANGKAYVVIRNTGEGVLSITDVKVAYGENAGTVAYTVSEDAITFANTVVNYVPSAEPNYDIISAEFTADTCRLFGTATMKVVTTQDVAKIKMTGLFGLNANPTVKSVDETEDGKLIWTIQMSMLILGNRTYTVTGYGEDGTKGAAATDSIRVKLF